MADGPNYVCIRRFDPELRQFVFEPLPEPAAVPLSMDETTDCEDLVVLLRRRSNDALCLAAAIQIEGLRSHVTSLERALVEARTWANHEKWCNVTRAIFEASSDAVCDCGFADYLAAPRSPSDQNPT